MAPNLRETPTLRLLRALHRAPRRIERVDGAGIALHGLQRAEFDVVATLGNTEGLRMGELASRMLTSPANVTRLVKALEKRGLVRRERSRTSDREVVARLTARGAALFERSYPAQVEYLRAAFEARLTPRQQETLIDLLGRLEDLPSAEDG